MTHRPRIPGTSGRRRIVVVYDGEPVRAVVDAVRVHGCTCDPPDLECVGTIGDVRRFVVFHRVGCPLCPPGEWVAE
jgi:hypothetical protein